MWFSQHIHSYCTHHSFSDDDHQNSPFVLHPSQLPLLLLAPHLPFLLPLSNSHSSSSFHLFPRFSPFSDTFFFLPPSSLCGPVPSCWTGFYMIHVDLPSDKCVCACAEGADLLTCARAAMSMCVRASACDRGADMSDRGVVFLLKSCWRPLTFWRGQLRRRAVGGHKRGRRGG